MKISYVVFLAFNLEDKVCFYRQGNDRILRRVIQIKRYVYIMLAHGTLIRCLTLVNRLDG